MKQPKQPAGPAAARRRKPRARPLPKWLKEAQDLDEVAKARCLMILSVLSGERPVTEVIAEAKVSRGTYYQLEERALQAMLSALNPASSTSASDGQVSPSQVVAALSSRVARL